MWHIMSIEKNMVDAVVLAELGERIAGTRLNKNITQKHLAKEAGVSLPTLQRLEQGESISATNLVRVLRALGLLENFNALVPEQPVSPMMQVKMRGNIRERASGKRKKHKGKQPKDEQTWQWSK